MRVEAKGNRAVVRFDKIGEAARYTQVLKDWCESNGMYPEQRLNGLSVKFNSVGAVEHDLEALTAWCIDHMAEDLKRTVVSRASDFIEKSKPLQPMFAPEKPVLRKVRSTHRAPMLALLSARMRELNEMDYSEFLQTPEWLEKRAQVLERDGHRCVVCNSKDRLEVHHRTYERRGYERLSDLTTLCHECHELFTKHGKLAKES
jgi:hypothetical protein